MPAMVGGSGNYGRPAASMQLNPPVVLTGAGLLTTAATLTSSGTQNLAGSGLLSATAAFPDPVGQSAGAWTGVFRDEFNSSPTVTDATSGYVNFGGPTWKAWYPDTTNFTSQSPGGAHTNNTGREKQYYDPSALSVASGVLSMTATFDSAHAGLPYTSGMVCTYPNFTFKFGYVEARIKCSGVGGTWPAFWLACSELSGGSTIWPPEVDMMEQFGTATGGKTTTYLNTGGGTTGSLNVADAGVNMTTGFHVFGVKWTSTTLTFYVDGVQYAQETNTAAVPSRNMYVLLDLAVDGSQSFTAGSGYPTTFQADYVRVWQ